jgi:head-tail adaptor
MKVFDPLLIDPGELRHQVQIQKASATRDAAGQPISTWDVVLTAYAKIDGPAGRGYRESFANNVLSSEASDFITIRWPGLSITVAPGMRVIFGNNTYLIQAVDNVLHRNRKVNLACIQVNEDSN